MNLNFGGMSTPWGVYYFSDNYHSFPTPKLKISWRGIKIESSKTEVKKNKGLFSKQWHLFLLFALGDLILIYKDKIDALSKSFNLHATPSPIVLHALQSPYIQLLVAFLMLFVIIAPYAFVYWFLTRTRGYHAAEHMTIASVEKENDIKNVSGYSRIHERCGTNLMPLYFIFLLISAFLFIPLPGTSIISSMMCFKKVPLLKKFCIGIGKKLQLFTTREPNKKELNDAVRGMTDLLKAEGIIKTAYHPMGWR